MPDFPRTEEYKTSPVRRSILQHKDEFKSSAVQSQSVGVSHLFQRLPISATCAL